MTNDTDFIRRGFVSERRNLLVASFVLFFYQASGIVIEEINFFGNRAKVSDPYWVSLSLWIFWLYFLIRLYQYFRDIPDKGIKASYNQKIGKLIKNLAEERFARIFVPSESYKRLKPQFNFGRSDVLFSSPSYWQLKMWATVHYQLETGSRAEEKAEKVLELNWKHLLLPNLMAFLHIALNTRLATEYMLPFVVALLPVAYFFFSLAFR